MGTTLEEHWRALLLERLQKLELLADDLKTHVGDMKTQAAVQAAEAKSRAEYQTRAERELSDLTRIVREIERKLDRNPPGHDLLEIRIKEVETTQSARSKEIEADLAKRLKEVEEWKSNLTGKLVAYGSLGMIVAGCIIAGVFKLIGLG